MKRTVGFIITEEDIVNAYPEGARERIKQYFQVIGIREKTGKSSHNISKETGIPIGRVKHWIYDKNTPFEAQGILELKEKGLVPLKIENTEKFLTMLDCFAFVFGDGNLTEYSVMFTGNPIDLNVLKKKLSKLGYRGEIKKKKLTHHLMPNGKFLNGTSFTLRICSVPLAKLLVAMGAPKGNKTINEFKIPEWLMEAPLFVKKRFLGVIYGNEGSTPAGGLYGSVLEPRLKFSKDVELKNNHEEYLKQLKRLFGDMEIKTSVIRAEKQKNNRKDGIVTYHAYFNILGSYINIMRFCKKVPILYNSKKAARFEDITKICNGKLRKGLEKISKYDTCIELSKREKNIAKIARGLGVNKRTAHCWIKNGNKPFMHDKVEEIERVLSKDYG